jgi:hypothetical protein
MKKIVAQLFILLLVLPAKFLSAQEKQPFNTDNIPLDKITKLISYTEVVQLKSLSTKVLYKRAFDWFNTYYKNPTDVIREADSTKGTIVGKSRFKISNAPDKKGLRTDAGLIMYTIKVSVREGRYKYEITELNQKAASYSPLEPWLDTSSKTYNPAYPGYFEQIDTEIRDAIESLKRAMSTTPPVKNDNW